MKKTILYIGCMALVMAACNKMGTMESPTEEPTMESPRHLTVDIKVDREGDTRSTKSGWEAGDVIYVAFDHFFTSESNMALGINASPGPAYYMTLTYDGASWKSAISNPALEDYLLEGGGRTGQLVAVYHSTMRDPVITYANSKKSANINTFYQRLNFSSDSRESGYFLSTSSRSSNDYSVQDGTLTATLNIGFLYDFVYFYLRDISSENAGRYSFKSSKFSPAFLTGFWSLHKGSDGFQAPDISSSEDFGAPIPATALLDGIYFYGKMYSNLKNVETEYDVQIIDNGGTPDDDSDDLTYTLTKTATLAGKEAIELPPLTDPRWVR